MTSPADVQGALLAQFPSATARISSDHAAIHVPVNEVILVLKAARDEYAFDMLMDITGIDWGVDVTPRFTAVWHLYSTRDKRYVRITSDCVSDSDPTVPTACGLWPGANWHERETYDLLGIKFSGHPDLRRILMWDGYPYHPLRKDFPLAGIETALPDEEIAEATQAKVIAAPMVGGPFVASTGEINLTEMEPRAKDESWNEKRTKPE